jgi:hypothetical protein
MRAERGSRIVVTRRLSLSVSLTAAAGARERQVPKCSKDLRTYREWSPLVVVLLHPSVATVRRVCAMRAPLVAGRPPARLEVLVYRHIGTRTSRDGPHPHHTASDLDS